MQIVQLIPSLNFDGAIDPKHSQQTDGNAFCLASPHFAIVPAISQAWVLSSAYSLLSSDEVSTYIRICYITVNIVSQFIKSS